MASLPVQDGKTRVQDAWHDLFTAAYPRLAGWARKLVGDEDVAHDIASEAFTRLMGRWSKVDDPTAYLYRIATNLVNDHWRRRARERRTVLSAIAEQRETGGEPPQNTWEMTDMVRALPERLRNVVILHYLAGFGVHDVAQMLGRPDGTVKSDLYQARQRLRAAWDPSND